MNAVLKVTLLVSTVLAFSAPTLGQSLDGGAARKPSKNAPVQKPVVKKKKKVIKKKKVTRASVSGTYRTNNGNIASLDILAAILRLHPDPTDAEPLAETVKRETWTVQGPLPVV